MVSLRGNNNAVQGGSLQGSTSNNTQPHRSRLPMGPNMGLQATSLNMQQQVINQHYQPAAAAMNMPPLNAIPTQYIAPQTNAAMTKPEQYRLPNMNRILTSPHFRLVPPQPIRYGRVQTPHNRTECYHTSGMPTGGPGAVQNPGQNSMRGMPPTAQTPTPPQSQQDLAKQGMTAFVPTQSQTPQSRPPATNTIQSYQFRTAQTAARPAPHHRQPQAPPLFNSNGGRVTFDYASMMMYHPNYDQYAQPPGSQRFYAQNMMLPHGFAYSFTNQPPPQYTACYQNLQQLAASSGTTEYFGQNAGQGAVPSMPGTGPANSGSMGLVAPPGPSTTPNEPSNTPIQHSAQPQPHIHQNLPGLPSSNTVNSKTREKKGIPIINPHTGKEIEIEQSGNQSHSTGDTSERQTPQPLSNSIAEEFSNMVKEAANKSTYDTLGKPIFIPKNTDAQIPMLSHLDACQLREISNSSNNNNVLKTDSIPLNASKSKGVDLRADSSEPPVVSAISDSPVIVPKVCPATTKYPKNTEQHALPSMLDNNKNLQIKQLKQNKNKPVVPPPEEEKLVEPVAPQPQRVKKHSESRNDNRSNRTDTSPLKAEEKNVALVNAMPAAVFVPAAAPPVVVASVLVSPPAPIDLQTPAPQPVPAPLPTVPVVRPNGPEISSAAINIVERLPEVNNLPTSQTNYKNTDNLPNITQKKPPTVKPTAGLREIEPPVQPPNAETVRVTETPQTVQTPLFSHVAEPSSISAKSVTVTVTLHITDNTSSQQVQGSSSHALRTLPQALIPSTQPLGSSSQPQGPSPQSFPISSFPLAKLASPPPELELDTPASQAQAKLHQSLVSCNKHYQVESKMKDLNLNEKTMTDQDTENGNTTDSCPLNKNENKDNNNKNENPRASRDRNLSNQAESDPDAIIVSYNESEKTAKSNIETEQSIINTEEKPNTANASQDDMTIAEKATPVAPPPETVQLPKYRYTNDQWSPFNPSGKKSYDINFLMQLKDDPQSKKLPDNMHLLELVTRPKGTEGPISLSTISRPNSESFLPPFAKPSGPMRGASREAKKNLPQSKSSVKGAGSTSQSAPGKSVIHVNLSLRGDVKLNETENAWKPSRLKKTTLSEEEAITQELYKKFRGILNKLTPQKFNKLLDQVKSLEINTQQRLEGVIDLVFEKAIDEPSFSEAYAAMCQKLSMLMVPADNSTDQYVNFRVLIISKCQAQFQTTKVQEDVVRLEKELADSKDQARKKEIILMLEEENRKMRMRSVGNVRFIGELYKLRMLTAKIMVYCMNNLINKLEEEKLECLCKLLTTIGEQVESDAKDQLDAIFKKMQDIVDRKANSISSRVRFMIQDVIESRRRRWSVKSVTDSQPKMMDQIQKEAEQKQRQIEIMNSAPVSGGGGFRGGREEGGRGKRGDGRRSGGGSSGSGYGPNYMDNSNWQVSSSRGKMYAVDTSKLKAAANAKNIGSIKLGPPMNSGWNQGSGAKNPSATSAMGTGMSLPATTTTNMYTLLETDPTTLRGKNENPGSQHSKGASIERSTFSSKTDYSSGSSGRTSANDITRSSSTSAPTPERTQPSARAETPVLPSEPLSDTQKKLVKATIEQCCLVNPNDEELITEIKQRFSPGSHAAIITEVLNVVWELKPTSYATIAKSLCHLITTNTISAENLLLGLAEHFEFAPDLHIDIPKLYDYLAMIVAPQIVNKNIKLDQLLGLSDNIISLGHGHLFLQALFNELKISMGPSFVKSKWQESGMQLHQWMDEEQEKQFLEDKNFEFLKDGITSMGETNTVLSPEAVQSKLLELMNTDQTYVCLKGWIKDNVGPAVAGESFMRMLIQAICEFALFCPEGRSSPRFNQERMSRYINLINEFGLSKPALEASCLLGIQQLIHRLEHPQGVTLEIFQYLSEMYISQEGFLAWEKSDSQREGKGVMLKALTSFFTDIKEADNEDSCSED